jgi:flagellar FliJ protein
MKKFKFTLEKVLEVKEIEEKVIQRQLQKVQSQIFENEKYIALIAEKISEERVKVNTKSEKVMHSSEMMLHYNYLESLKADMEHYMMANQKLRLEELDIQSQLVEKSKEKKALERLREIKYEEFRRDYNKEQQSFLDDISIQGHRLKAGSV